MCVIYMLDFTAAGVISMNMYSCIAQCDSCLNLALKMLMAFACTVSFAKFFQSRMMLALKKVERTPLAS